MHTGFQRANVNQAKAAVKKETKIRSQCSGRKWSFICTDVRLLHLNELGKEMCQIGSCSCKPDVLKESVKFAWENPPIRQRRG